MNEDNPILPEEEGDEEFNPRDYFVNDAEGKRSLWVKKKLHEHGERYTIPNASKGNYSGFDEEANYDYLSENYSSFLNELSDAIGFNAYTIEHADPPEDSMPFSDYLDMIDEGVWDEFESDVEACRRGECLDEHAAETLRSEAENTWWTDNTEDFKEELRKQEWAHTPLMTFLIGKLTTDNLASMAGDEEHYTDDQGDGSVYCDLEAAAKDIDMAAVMAKFNDQMIADYKPEWEELKKESCTSEGSEYSWFIKFLDAAVKGRPDLEATYAKMDDAALWEFFNYMLDNKPASAGDDYPRWIFVKNNYGSTLVNGWHVMYPVDSEEWRKMGSVEKIEHFVEGMREFVDKYALPMLARWRYPREHPEFKFESWLAEADAAVTAPPDEEGDEEFDPRGYLLQQPQSGTVVKDSPTLRIIQLDTEEVESRVAAIGHRYTDWERHDAVYLIAPEGADQAVMGVKYSGDIYRLDTQGHTAKQVLHEMPYSKELRRFFRSIANKWIKDGNEQGAMYMFTLLYGAKVILKYMDKYDIGLSLKLSMGVDLAKAGDYANAAKLLSVSASRLTPHGALFTYPDWSALSRFFARPEQRTAESILSGDPVDADWVFDANHRPEVENLTGTLGKEDFDLIREVLPHRRICPYGDGQFVLLSSKLLADFDNSDIEAWLDNEDENFDPEGELQDIRDAIIRAACRAMEEANSNAYYEGYKEAVLDGLGASAKMVAGKVVLTVPWDYLKSWADDAENEPADLDDLIDYAPRVEANEEGYSTDRYDDDAFLLALDSELSELDMPEYPYDPDQQMLPGILPPNPHEKVYAHFFSQHYPGGAQVRTTRGELDRIKKTEPWRLDKDQWDAYAAKNDLPPLSPTRPVSEALASALLEEHYSYSSTQLDVTPPQSDFIFEWGRLNIPDENLAISPENENPRELHQHVTVNYGLTVNEAPQELRDLCKGIKPFPVYIGKVSLFRNDEYDVVKLNVESLELRQLNAEISALIPNEDKYPEYTPHLTVAYVKKGTCDALEGMDIFTGKESGVDPQFVAYGLKFCPAGEESAQAEEVILFSRVKKPVPPQQELESAGKPESSMESEPFVGLPFPLDPRSVKPFLQQAARSKATPLVL